MNTTQIIAHNLSAWMAATPHLGTIDKLKARSGVGFGTVQRAKNGDGNTTIENLAAIAKAFGKRPEHLMMPPEGVDLLPPTAPPLTRKLVQQLSVLAEQIDDDGLRGLVEVAACFTKTHPLMKKPAPRKGKAA